MDRQDMDQTGEAGSDDDIPLLADGSPFPYYIQQPHEVNPGFHFDWTICPDDWPREEALRQVQNKLLERQLKEGLAVAYRQSGWSCYPRIHKNDLCYFEPTSCDWEWDDLQVGDIVFCVVEPGFRYCTHQIKKIEWVWDDDPYVYDWEPHYTISDLKGRETGRCFHTNIYGKLIFVE